MLYCRYAFIILHLRVDCMMEFRKLGVFSADREIVASGLQIWT